MFTVVAYSSVLVAIGDGAIKDRLDAQHRHSISPMPRGHLKRERQNQDELETRARRVTILSGFTSSPE